MVNEHIGHSGLPYIEKRLSPPERRRVEAHLAVCAACRAEIAELADTVNMLDAMPAAMRAMPWSPDRAWLVVWARLQTSPLKRPAYPAWQLGFSLALVMSFFTLTSLWPRVVATGVSVTIGVGSAPRMTEHTPLAFFAPHPALPPTAVQTHSVSTAAPAPIPTPMNNSIRPASQSASSDV
jgi:hypothetical protein